MKRNLLPASIMFLGLCIVLSSWLISQSLKSNQANELQNKYDFNKIAGDFYIIMDKQTGEIWRKIGGDDWEKLNSINDIEN
ncbi:hypothetical protein ACSVDA_21260 [Cytobacillus sp. Hm23]